MPVVRITDSYGDAPIDGVLTEFHEINTIGQSNIDPEFPQLQVWLDNPENPEADSVETNGCFIEEVYSGTEDPQTVTVEVADSYENESLNSTTHYENTRFAKRVVDQNGPGIIVVQTDSARPPNRLVHREGEIVGVIPNRS